MSVVSSCWFALDFNLIFALKVGSCFHLTILIEVLTLLPQVRGQISSLSLLPHSVRVEGLRAKRWMIILSFQRSQKLCFTVPLWKLVFYGLVWISLEICMKFWIWRLVGALGVRHQFCPNKNCSSSTNLIMGFGISLIRTWFPYGHCSCFSKRRC